MKNRYYFPILTVMILLTLMVSAVMTVPAYADDGTPPPSDPAAGEVAPAGDSTAPADSAPVVDSAPAEEQPAIVAESAPVVEDSEPVVENPTAADILTQIPEGMDVVVTDASGDVVPLATSEAAQTIVHGDPQWCPAGVAPGGSSCSPSFTGFTDDASPDTGLIAWLNDSANFAAVSKAGTIWVAYDYSTTETGIIEIDGTLVAGTMKDFALTIQGGWGGTPGSTALSTAAQQPGTDGPTSTLNVQFSIINWNAAVTLNNITVTANQTTLVTNDVALRTETTGAITLNSVNVVKSVDVNSDAGDPDPLLAAAYTMHGAYLYNAGSTTAAGVTVNNSSFDENTGIGLEIDSKGIVTIKNIAANGNGKTGAWIKNNTADADKAVTITGVQQFSNNGENGLEILSRGAITLANVVANDNTKTGAFLTNTDSSTKLGVTIGGINQFNGNDNDGLNIDTKGVITLSNITANGNNYNGAYLKNSYTGAPKAVTLTGVNTFNGNTTANVTATNGLTITSLGAITISNLTASDNLGTGTVLSRGAYLNNNFTGATGGVTISGYGTFTNNKSDGLYIDSLGIILLNTITANTNGGNGALIDNSDVTLPKAVTLTGVNTFNGNTTANVTDTHGLTISSKGAITISNLTASDNLGDGTVDTPDMTTNYPSNGAYLDNSFTGAVGGVTISGYGTFTNNKSEGLYLDSLGVILLANMTANKNGDVGAFIANSDAALPKAVTLTGVNTFNGNGINNTTGSHGLVIRSLGAIAVSNLTANDNLGNGTVDTPSATTDRPSRGAYLENNFTGAVGGVTISGYGTFTNNKSDGLYINSLGVILLANMTANKNGGNGALIENFGAALPKAVTLTGVNTFNGNTTANVTDTYGLYISSKGAITISNLTASDNIGDGTVDSPDETDNYPSGGAYLDNDYTGAVGGVTISGYGTFTNNKSDGLYIDSRGVILLANMTANKNGDSGADIFNSDAALPKAVTLTGVNTFNGNGINNTTGSHGLAIQSKGAITISNLTANDNLGNGTVDTATLTEDRPSRGAHLDNDYIGAGGVTISGYGTFENNASYGLMIYSKGIVLLNNINANKNGYGAFINNCGPTFDANNYDMTCATVGKGITLAGVNNFNGNAGYGLEALSSGLITASNVTANANGGGDSRRKPNDVNAPAIGNALLDSELGITMTGVNTFNYGTANTIESVVIFSDGPVTVSNLTASNNNNGSGARVSGDVTTMLTGFNTFNNNSYTGLSINDNQGAITLNNVTANSNNGGSGVYITNNYVNTTPWNVTLLGVNTFNGNASAGLDIVTYGAVALNNITANGNAADGLAVDNATGALATMPKTITITGFNTFNNNTGAGLNLTSNGLITLNNITANGNVSAGALLGNSGLAASAASPGVIINGANNSFSYNTGGDGLKIITKGVITLANINASSNFWNGASLYNQGGLAKAVTLTGVNTFNGNINGLVIQSSGIVTLSRVTANNNIGGDGIYVDTSANITLTCASAYNNTVYGVNLNSTAGKVTVNGLYAYSNGTGSKQIISSLTPAVTYPCALP